MNHTPLSKPEPLLPELVAELERIRARRAFDADAYIAQKVMKLGEYLGQHGLKGAVVGLSGGIDSAVVLGLLRKVKRLYPEVLTRVVPIAMPVYGVNASAIVGQREALIRAVRLCQAWQVDEWSVYDLDRVHAAYQQAIDGQQGPSTEWAAGQLVSYLRTPALYYTTSLLTAAGTPAVVVGTTNRDEGSYLGYVGKASDGMVDIQLIADLHKSEVRAVAKVLGVTQEILDIAPTGDMYDGRVDEEVFGAPYDFVELYLGLKCLLAAHLPQGRSPEAEAQYQRFSASLEALHSYSAHKYLVGSPAVHLNALPSAVPGGWRE